MKDAFLNRSKYYKATEAALSSCGPNTNQPFAGVVAILLRKLSSHL
jgi:hypothetical protein